MPVNYAVQAEVVDVRGDVPSAADRFFVDTNVWLWVAYARILRTPSQSKYYSPYLSAAHRAGAKLHFCPLSQAELAHQIEDAEYQRFMNANPTFRNLTRKEFRHNHATERANVVAQVQSAWAVVTGMAACVPAVVDAGMSAAALTRFGAEALDGYDLFMLEAAKASGISQILTDDGDYCGVPGIRMFTANHNVISAAAAAGKLVVR